MNQPLIIYHDKCMDGFCAATVARQKFPEATFFPANFGEPAPDVLDKDVFVIDFSYPREILLEMKKQAKSLTVLDHHASAARDLEGLDFCVFDMKRSGAGLAWDYLFPDQERPLIVNYVEDRDLWKFELPHSKEVNAAITCCPFEAPIWEELFTKTFSDLLHEGQAVLRYQNRVVKELAEKAQLIDFAGYQIYAVNTPTLFSEVTNLLAKDRPFALYWFKTETGKYKYGIRRHSGDLDLSVIAAKFGGGGHPGASGFILDELIV